MMPIAFATAALLIVTAIWGLGFVFVQDAVAHMDVYYFNFLRFLVAALTLAVVFHRKLKPVKPALILSAATLAVLIAAGYAFQTEGLKITTVSNSALISGLYIVLIPMIERLFLKTRIRINQWMGVFLAFLGMGLLTFNGRIVLNTGDLLTFGCALTFAWHIVLLGKYCKACDYIALVIYQLIAVALFFGVASIFTHGYSSPISAYSWGAIVFTGVLATAFAFMVQTAAQKILSATEAGTIMSLEALFGVLFGWGMRGDSMTVLKGFGAVLMITGMIVSGWNGKKSGWLMQKVKKIRRRKKQTVQK